MSRVAKVLVCPCACPYCKVGRIDIQIEQRADGSSEMLGAAEPRQCPACKRFSKPAIRLHVHMKPLPDALAGAGASPGEILRHITGVN